jgi:hypothetical protein
MLELVLNILSRALHVRNGSTERGPENRNNSWNYEGSKRQLRISTNIMFLNIIHRPVCI